MLNKIIKDFSNKNLNNLDEFEDKTTSIENLSKVIWNKFSQQLKNNNIETIEVKIWENDNNCVSYVDDIKD